MFGDSYMVSWFLGYDKVSFAFFKVAMLIQHVVGYMYPFHYIIVSLVIIMHHVLDEKMSQSVFLLTTAIENFRSNLQLRVRI